MLLLNISPVWHLHARGPVWFRKKENSLMVLGKQSVTVAINRRLHQDFLQTILWLLLQTSLFWFLSCNSTTDTQKIKSLAIKPSQSFRSNEDTERRRQDVDIRHTHIEKRGVSIQFFANPEETWLADLRKHISIRCLPVSDSSCQGRTEIQRGAAAQRKCDAFMVKQFQTLVKIEIVLLCDSDSK